MTERETHYQSINLQFGRGDARSTCSINPRIIPYMHTYKRNGWQCSANLKGRAVDRSPRQGLRSGDPGYRIHRQVVADVYMYVCIQAAARVGIPLLSLLLIKKPNGKQSRYFITIHTGAGRADEELDQRSLTPPPRNRPRSR